MAFRSDSQMSHLYIPRGTCLSACVSCRINTYIKLSMDGTKILSTLMDVFTEQSARSSHTAAPQSCSFPTDGWKLLKQAYKSPNAVPRFNNGHVVSYFVTRLVIDGLPSSDFKSINSSAENLFRCGHIHSNEICSATTALYIQASSLPEMKKDMVYNLSLALNHNYDII